MPDQTLPVNTVQAIRDYFAQHPNASSEDVAAALGGRGSASCPPSWTRCGPGWRCRAPRAGTRDATRAVFR